MKPPTGTIALWSLLSATHRSVSITFLMRACFTMRDSLMLLSLLVSITFEVGDGESTTDRVFGKFFQSPLSRLMPHETSYLCRSLRRWKVMSTYFSTKHIVDVHRLVSTKKNRTGKWVAIIASIWSACLPRHERWGMSDYWHYST